MIDTTIVVWLNRNDVCAQMKMYRLEAVFGSPEKDKYIYKKKPNLNTKCVQTHTNAHRAHTSNKHPEWGNALLIYNINVLLFQLVC